jgi:hypothetical protein
MSLDDLAYRSDRRGAGGADDLQSGGKRSASRRMEASGRVPVMLKSCVSRSMTLRTGSSTLPSVPSSPQLGATIGRSEEQARPGGQCASTRGARPRALHCAHVVLRQNIAARLEARRTFGRVSSARLSSVAA